MLLENRMLLEICVDCVESALAAQDGGADRIEICGSLASGGITPSAGLVRQCIQLCKLPCMVMIRPHDGGFVYGDNDVRTMLDDIDALKDLDIHGVVLGALTRDGHVDVDVMQRLMRASRPLQVTFHRAYDVTRDPFKALDAIINLGCDRLLTSGQRTTAQDGASMIRQIVQHADGRLTVMAGAGINSSNVKRVVDTTHVREIHASASLSRAHGSTSSDVRFGANSRVTSTQRVRELIEKMPRAPRSD